uniref:p10 protein n=1 Tax=Spodoptera litura multicapsid nucleopolyhedrovirus TaxID=46242 RepID=Q88169_NPVST|nr:p10 protein [Spodoptera litura nucleopolyhedrovirus]
MFAFNEDPRIVYSFNIAPYLKLLRHFIYPACRYDENAIFVVVKMSFLCFEARVTICYPYFDENAIVVVID